MLKHYIDFEHNSYIIERDGVIVFSIDLKANNEVKIRTAEDVYNGDVLHISFKK